MESPSAALYKFRRILKLLAPDARTCIKCTKWANEQIERREDVWMRQANGDVLGAGAAPLVRVRQLTKSFGDTIAVKALDLDIASGDFFAILGPSGCGKTTLLRMMGGFVWPSGGTIEINGRDLTRLPPDKRPTNMVFQGYGLFPHMSVRQNIGYGLRIAGIKGEALRMRVNDAIELVQLGDLRDRDIAQLSGGQQQRVALARALVMRPPVLLLDEPLAALDLKLRQAMQDELRRIHQEIGGTFVFVTHDQGEAMSLANRVAVMNEGTLMQVSSTVDIYRHPTSEFVATFVGDANMLAGRRRDDVVELDNGIKFPHRGRNGPVMAVIRPEDIALSEGEATFPEATVAVPVVVAETVFLGSAVRCRLNLQSSGGTLLVSASPSQLPPTARPGERLTARWSVASQTILDR
jgi:ABC-type Fe3+/spermidine/putrescine transport system ATPase subunit